MRVSIALPLVPAIAWAQASFPTTFPAEAQALSPETLKQRLAGKTFVAKPAVGDEMRVQYDDNYAFIDVGRASDSGKWRIEGSSVCVNWQRFPHGCSEVRMVGDVIYLKRVSNGEVLVLQPKCRRAARAPPFRHQRQQQQAEQHDEEQPALAQHRRNRHAGQRVRHEQQHAEGGVTRPIIMLITTTTPKCTHAEQPGRRQQHRHEHRTASPRCREGSRARLTG